ncbi:hypothetical protein LGK95_05410 [Clostridium algoriphilum]|nr:hypothetical protein [Clostridium algoriphilum]MCB2292959.1 hypothetical protein [Clostridium algoriphilum]
MEEVINNVEVFFSHSQEFNSYKVMGWKLRTKNGKKGAGFSVWVAN